MLGLVGVELNSPAVPEPQTPGPEAGLPAFQEQFCPAPNHDVCACIPTPAPHPPSLGCRQGAFSVDTLTELLVAVLFLCVLGDARTLTPHVWSAVGVTPVPPLARAGPGC